VSWTCSRLDLTGTLLPSTSSYISLYSLTKDGAPCILLLADASITFTYKTKSGDDRVSLILYIIIYTVRVFRPWCFQQIADWLWPSLLTQNRTVGVDGLILGSSYNASSSPSHIRTATTSPPRYATHNPRLWYLSNTAAETDLIFRLREMSGNSGKRCSKGVPGMLSFPQSQTRSLWTCNSDTFGQTHDKSSLIN
jgi:hypothetical protein